MSDAPLPDALTSAGDSIFYAVKDHPDDAAAALLMLLVEDADRWAPLCAEILERMARFRSEGLARDAALIRERLGELPT